MEEILFTQVMDNLYSYYLQLVLKIKSQVIIAVFCIDNWNPLHFLHETPQTHCQNHMNSLLFLAIMGKRFDQPTHLY